MKKKIWKVVENGLLVFMVVYLIYTLFFHAGDGGGVLLIDPPVSTDPSYQLLHPALDFTLPDLKGVSHSLHGSDERPVLLTIWTPWCGACKHELPDLEYLASTMKESLRVVSIVTSYQHKAEVKALAEQLGLRNLTVLLDVSGEIAAQYHITGYPTTFMIDSKGILRYRLFGTRNWKTNEAVKDLQLLHSF